MIEEFETGFGPIVTSLTGFIQYTAAQTGNTSTVFFMNIFDTQANAHGTWSGRENHPAKNPLIVAYVSSFVISHILYAFVFMSFFWWGVQYYSALLYYMLLVAQEAAKNFVGRNAKLGNDAIIPNQFHELTVATYITPLQDDPGNNDSSDPATCKQDSYAGKFLSTRLYESVESVSVEATQNLTLGANAKKGFSTQPGFFSYLGT